MQFAYLIGSLSLSLIWVVIWFSLKSKESRAEMVKVSLATSLLGFTEPIFVPAYWNPPTLFNLASKTGFDLESLVFAFAVGGIAVAAYELFWKGRHQEITQEERHHPQHKFHLWALLAAPVSFLILFLATSLNPIYSTVTALLVGAVATFYCRPDLIRKMVSSGLLFLSVYFFFFLVFNLLFPGYTEEVWNLKAISGILILKVPLEELLFAFSFGLMWSSVYEHTSWRIYKEKP
ncbi:MAG TPA: lycopene cyclase domain-containing protein [Candidatus Nanoarchaeia archaeon]|nr:hypothetical protein [uncultured archaeon]